MCDEPDVTQIMPFVWLGNYRAAYNKHFLEKYNIRCLICAAQEYPNKFPELRCLDLAIDDRRTCGKDMTHLFATSSTFIKDCVNEKENILIYCKTGHHRSASVVAAYMLRYMDVDYISAISYINKRRKNALIRNSCMLNNLFNYYIHINSIVVKNNICTCRHCYKYNDDTLIVV
jgi:protein-tyrosine phosphatase